MSDDALEAVAKRHADRLLANARERAQERADLYNVHGVPPPRGQKGWRASDFLPQSKQRRNFSEICAAYGVVPPQLPIT